MKMRSDEMFDLITMFLMQNKLYPEGLVKIAVQMAVPDTGTLAPASLARLCLHRERLGPTP